LTEQVVAALLIVARQGIELRRRAGGLAVFGDEAAAMYEDLCQRIALVQEDRALDGELRQLCQWQREQVWDLYGHD